MGLPGQLKPSRSDAGENLSEAEQARYAKQVEEYLKATTPVRALKPSRSDLEDGALWNVDSTAEGACKAEMDRYKELENSGEVLKTEGGTVNDDTYVETPYYDDLNAVDKTLHHQTGTGFIATEQASLPFTFGEDGVKIFRTTNQTNPACNEWQPEPPKDEPTEPKVHRSESS